MTLRQRIEAEYRHKLEKRARLEKRVLVGLLVVLLASIGSAQQQFSGGSAVVLSAGTAIVGKFGIDQTTPGTTNLVAAGQNGNWSVRAQDGSGNALTSTASALDINIKSGNTALNSGTAKIGVTYPYTSCGTTSVTQVLVALPTTSTAVTASTFCLLTLTLHNSSASTSYTVTVTDGQGSPVPLLNVVTMNPGEYRQMSYPNGLKMTTGLKWSASNVAVTGAVEGLQ